ncbi:MAG: ABC transporter ATP-binding protein [Dokdonella sp.]
MSPSPLLAVSHVGYQLRERRLVDDIDLAVSCGEVLGLLGVNGAGKTTTLRMIAGVLAPTSGSIRIDGADLYEQPELARRRIGYLPERPPLHDELTVREYLAFCARLRGISRDMVETAVIDAMASCDLTEQRQRLIGTLSQGFRQRIGIAQAIVHQPDLVVLDEPAAGLDPVQAQALRTLIGELGRTRAVILSTHLLNDVTACCDRIAILHHGRLRYTSRLDDLASRDVQSIAVGRDLAMVDWLALPEVVAAEPAPGRRWRVQLSPNADLAALASAVVTRGWGMTELRPDHAALDAIFLDIALSPAMDEAA